VSLLPESVQRQLRAGYLEDVALVCFTIDHSNLPDPIRLVGDRDDLDRSAGTFQAFPFSFKLGNQTDSEIPFGEISATNVSGDIVAALRTCTGGERPTLKYECVFDTAPNDVVHGPLNFVIVGADADLDAVSIQFALDYEFLNSAFPKDIFAPTNRG